MKNTTKNEPTKREIQEVATMVIEQELRTRMKDFVSLLEDVGNMGGQIRNSVSDHQDKFIAKGNYDKQAIHTAMENVIHDFRAYEESFNKIKDWVDNGFFDDDYSEELN